MRLRVIGLLVFAMSVISATSLVGMAQQMPSVDPSVGLPVQGQPAADVLASEDAWGDPTFIGGLTNSGPTAHSVW